MRTRLFAELSPPLTTHSPSDPAFLLIEATHINVILHTHDIHGILLNDVVHPTIDAARSDAANRFPGRLTPWVPIPNEYNSILDILAARRGHLIASGTPIDLTLDYHRPRKNLRRAYWWRGLAIYSGMQAWLLLAFGFVFVQGHPLLYYFLADSGRTGIMHPLLQGVMFGLIASTVLWTFPRVHGILTGLAIFFLGYELLIILTLGMRDATTSEHLVAVATALPFILFALWRSMHLASRWVEEE